MTVQVQEKTEELTAPKPAPKAPEPAPTPEPRDSSVKTTVPTQPSGNSLKEDTTLLGKIAWGLFYLTVGFAIFVGWRMRTYEFLTAESGWGYGLGIVGGGFMILMLVYSLRKRVRAMAKWGPIKYWFTAHMVMGILGPACVLFHANFHLGSMNSNLALFATLLVAGSGLVGRHIYRRVHYGLYGRRANLEELRNQFEADKGAMTTEFESVPETRSRMLAFSDVALKETRGLFLGPARALMIGFWLPWTFWMLKQSLTREFRVQAQREGWDAARLRGKIKAAQHQVKDFLALVRKVAEFNFYYRLFSLWHVLHLPLFMMLVVAGIFHVIAVHAY